MCLEHLNIVHSLGSMNEPDSFSDQDHKMIPEYQVGRH